MNRRDFIRRAAKSAAVFTILPGAGRIWKAVRAKPVGIGELVPWQQAIADALLDCKINPARHYRLRSQTYEFWTDRITYGKILAARADAVGSYYKELQKRHPEFFA